MRVIYLACGPHAPASSGLPHEEVLQVDAVPTRAQLRPLDAAAREVLPVDPTPSLEEIAQNPEVAHLGEPQRAPQHPDEELRVIVAGSDAALSAVLTRMMRGDYLWATVGYLPLDPASPAATTWGLPTGPALQELLAGDSIRPVPVIRTDTGLVVAGSATITDAEDDAVQGEIVVDDEVLLNQPVRPRDARFFSQFGARLVPMTTAPGIAAVRLTTPARIDAPRTPSRWATRLVNKLGPVHAQSWFETPALRWAVSKAEVRTGGADPRSLLTGRALQCGGSRLLVTVDGVAGRPTDRATFYRHLRDLQILRP
ncbi:hypothetical protein [Corynebacterium tapiri]|uniref:Uncharacterized protein n=1 Tax=Corynebacterium tapiri TaxID=1448266 RepID=A0A5C4U3J0_9CORY|nr:hypothetical protein [Corynebacterium tapiri]TNL95738.1 hypothetical protein FHE74_09090 [Corynebacterium tapiri]